jgi:hypothetical protein
MGGGKGTGEGGGKGGGTSRGREWEGVVVIDYEKVDCLYVELYITIYHYIYIYIYTYINIHMCVSVPRMVCCVTYARKCMDGTKRHQRRRPNTTYSTQ